MFKKAGRVIKAVIFDFGGVVAEEGFKQGLKAVAAGSGLDPDRFFAVARELIYETGYVTGRTDEHTYWNAVRAATGLEADDGGTRAEARGDRLCGRRSRKCGKGFESRMENDTLQECRGFKAGMAGLNSLIVHCKE